jgi:hypothetical protein
MDPQTSKLSQERPSGLSVPSAPKNHETAPNDSAGAGNRITKALGVARRADLVEGGEE